ncbi:hypothetical protein, conserved [Angomonas deanei]|uniref:Uncharacterized protein n=1 Tax=Angomonas deanei TaxID=59799 RepID=A0A7G2CAY6_9TRYP|nr:hypothetical protein, conserved [Angomonas deanei]
MNDSRLDVREVEGLKELRFSLWCTSKMQRKNIMGIVCFPSGVQHYLGPVTANKVTSYRLVQDVPPHFSLLICEDVCLAKTEEPPSQAEMLLKEHVKVILENDEFCGSIAADHLQNLVREFPFYKSAIARFKTWLSFIVFFEKKYRSWSIVMYDDKLHEGLGLTTNTPANELRIVATQNIKCFMTGDIRRDSCKEIALRELSTHLRQSYGDSYCILRNNKYSSCVDEKGLSQITRMRSFITLNIVNFEQSMRHSNPGKYVLYDAHHPLCVWTPKST